MSQTFKIRTYGSMIEAESARSYLEAHGVAASLPDSHAINMQPHLLEVFGGVRLMVDEINIERANELLKEVESRSHLSVVDFPAEEDGNDLQSAAHYERENSNRKKNQVRYLARFVIAVFLIFYALQFLKDKT